MSLHQREASLQKENIKCRSSLISYQCCLQKAPVWLCQRNRFFIQFFPVFSSVLLLGSLRLVVYWVSLLPSTCLKLSTANSPGSCQFWHSPAISSLESCKGRVKEQNSLEQTFVLCLWGSCGDKALPLVQIWEDVPNLLYTEALWVSRVLSQKVSEWPHMRIWRMSELLAEDKEEDSAPDREDVEGRVGYAVSSYWVLGKINLLFTYSNLLA